LLLVLGLGNPGDEYRGTRHNIGTEIVGSLIDHLRLRVKAGRGDYRYARVPSRDLLLAIPTTYVNTSGLAALQLLDHFGAATSDLLVVCDDFALPLGTLRIRKQGSDGGHNGLASIIYQLGSQEFARLRVGIGPLPEGMSSPDFVLSRFGPEEQDSIAEARAGAQEAVLAIASGGIDRAMNLYNVRQPGHPSEGDTPQGRTSDPGGCEQGGR
jgi:PTH1 family peptidyl-tRNA hydrolase